jgi:polar amino acid transport system substrate-binding protein
MHTRNKLLSSVVIMGLLALFGGTTAFAADMKCEPDKVATKYPSLAGKTIKIGQDGESPPYSFRDPKDFNHLIGIDADLARATFECAGVPVEFVTGAWSGLLPAVMAGQADVMWDTLFYTPERAKKVDFVIYLSAASGGLVAAGNPKQLKSADEACGLRGTAGLGTVEEAQLRDISAKCTAAGKAPVEIVTFPDIPAGSRLVQNGRADLMISDLAMIDSIAGGNPGAFSRAFTIETTDRKAVGLTKGNADLARAIMDGLTILKANGKAKAIFDTYHVDYGIMLQPEIVTK